MPLAKLAESFSCTILAKLIDLGAIAPDKPVTVASKSERCGLQVIVTIADYAPMHIHPDTQARIEAMRTSVISPPEPRPVAPPIKRPTQKEKILDLLKGQPARKAVWIALKLGKKKADGGLRETLSQMLKAGVLVKGASGNGYMLPTSEPSASEPDIGRAT